MSPDNPRQRYLRLALQMNPMWQASQLIDLRAQALRLNRLDASQGNQPQSNLSEMRQAAKRLLAETQENFWQMPLQSLKGRLEAIDIKKLPELAPVVGRLKTAAACRGEFPKLLQESWMDNKLFNAFKSAVALPPTEAGYAREAFIARIRDKAHLKKVKLSIRKLSSEYPVLFALEQDWFQTLSKHKLRYVNSDGTASSRSGISFSFPEVGWPLWLVIFVVLRVLLRLITSMGN